MPRAPEKYNWLYQGSVKVRSYAAIFRSIILFDTLSNKNRILWTQKSKFVWKSAGILFSPDILRIVFRELWTNIDSTFKEGFSSQFDMWKVDIYA